MAEAIKKIIRELLPHKVTIFIVALSGVLMSIAQSGTATLMKPLFDGMVEKNPDRIIDTSVAVLCLALVASVTRYFHFYLMNYVADQVTITLREKLISKYIRLNLEFHNQFEGQSGGLMSRILNDMIIIQHGLRMVADIFRTPIHFLILLGVLIWNDWQLTMTIFVVLPIVLLFLRQIARSLRKYGQQSQEIMETLTSTIKESLDGVRIIQSFNLEKMVEGRFFKTAKHFLQVRKKIHSRTELGGPVTEFIATFVIVGIAAYIGIMIAEGKSTLGDFALFITVLIQMQNPIKKFQESYVRIQETTVATQRAFELIEKDQEVLESSNPQPFPKDWKEIQFKDVRFSYDSDMILKGINLTVQRGEVIALVGQSGSGKSTLVNLLERFFEPTHGEISIDGVRIQDIDLKALRKNVALVTQDVFLFNDTIENNILAGDLDKDNQQLKEATRAANADPFISKLPEGYQSLVGDRGNLLSGGEKQRVSIARALFKDAPILILDEATSALDSFSEVEVQKGLDRLMEGKTTFVIAHRLSTVMRADKILVLKEGAIVQQGSHDQLLSEEGLYKQMYSLQTEVQ